MASYGRHQTVFINSVNRLAGGTPGDFRVNFHDGMIRAPPGTSASMALVDAVINRSWYTINETNNTFTILCIQGGSNVFTIPVGFYDVNTFKVALQVLLGIAYTVTYDSRLNKYTYTYLNKMDPFGYRFLFSDNRCAEFMGFGPLVGSTERFDGLTPLVATDPVKLSKESAVVIHCDIPTVIGACIDNFARGTFEESDVIGIIPMIVPPYDNMSFAAATGGGGGGCVFDLAVSDVSSARFYVTDENDRPLDLSFDWTLVLKFVFVNNDDDKMTALLTDLRDYEKLKHLNHHLKNNNIAP